jgi:protein-S-isoprenylcysteine O-methyltransferase
MNKPIGRISLIIAAYLLIIAMAYLGFATYQHNLTGWFLIITAFAYAVGGPFLLRSTLKTEQIIRHENQDRSFWLVVPGFIVVFFASPFECLLSRNTLSHSTWTQIVGLVLLLNCLLLFSWARFTLGNFYSGRVRVTTDHVLIQRGPYRFIRHPAYASYIIMSFGIAIGYSSLVGLLAIPLLMLPALIYRISIEEKLLSLEFGEQFFQYAHRTKRLLPYIW